MSTNGGSGGGGYTLKPNGSPDYGASVGASSGTGRASLWNYLPKDIPSGEQIWYDTQHVQTPDSYATSSTAAAENGTNNPIIGTHTTSQPIQGTPEEIMGQLASLSLRSPQEFQALQQGLSMWGTTEPGIWGPKTEAALGKAMSAWYQLHMTGSSITFKQFLENATQQVSAMQQAKIQAATPTVHLMDPAQIRAAAQSAAQQALGRSLSQKQLEQFVEQFHQEQMSNDPGDSFSTNYKLPGEAMQFVQHENAGDFAQTQTQSYANAFINMFAPTQSQRPNMTPTPAV